MHTTEIKYRFLSGMADIVYYDNTDAHAFRDSTGYQRELSASLSNTIIKLSPDSLLFHPQKTEKGDDAILSEAYPDCYCCYRFA